MSSAEDLWRLAENIYNGHGGTKVSLVEYFNYIINTYRDPKIRELLLEYISFMYLKDEDYIDIYCDEEWFPENADYLCSEWMRP